MYDAVVDFILYFVLTIVVASVGSIVARKLKMPAGGMMGAMIAVAVFNILTNKGVFPEELRPVVQIFSGALVGSRVSKKDVKALKYIIFPTIILMVFMTLMNVTLGFAINKFGGLDIATALFASSPGGLSDMALLAEELNANSTYVSLLQLIRILTVFAFMPTIIRRIINKRNAAQAAEAKAKGEPEAVVEQPKEELTKKQKAIRLLCTIGSAAVGGILFDILGVTAGPMLGSMIGAALFNIITDKGYFPKDIRNYTQIGSGAFLGMRIDMASVLGLAGLIVPAVIMVVGVLVFALVTAIVMHKVTKLDLSVCLMASTPGGLQEMSLLSEDLGADTPKIAVMQTARLMFVIALFPTMIEFLAGALG